MKIYLQIIQNYLNQQVPTIMLTIEKQKYIFNMASCFQRFIKDHKQKFPSGARIFFTKVNTDTLAGLSGFMLTIFQNKNCQDTKLYTNQKMYTYMEEIRYKMGFKMLPYSYSNIFTGQTRTGIHSVNKVYQFLQSDNFPQIFMNSEQYISQNLSAEQKNQSIKHLSIESQQYFDGDLRIKYFEIEACSEKMINYICIPNKLQGKVLMNKVKQFKVPPQMISKLMSQGTLLLESGQTVKAEWMKQGDQPSPNFIILHHNSIQSIDKVLSHPCIVQYIKNPDNQTNTVVHIIENTSNDQRIVQSQYFKQLISIFDEKVVHLIYNRHYKNQNYNPTKQPVPKHLQLVSFVNKYFPTCMPDVLGQHNSYINEHWNSCSSLQKLYPNHKLLSYKRCYELVLAPKKSQGYFPITQQGKQKDKRDLVAPQNLKSLAQLTQLYQQKNFEKLPYDFSEANSEVVFLGTGSMKPSKYRNVSSIFIEITHNNSILLDCGQGSYYQLYNHFGKQKINSVMMSIKTIFITHIHSDHNLGILDLIAERNKIIKRLFTKSNNQQTFVDQQKINANKLFLIIPYNVLPWFNSYVSNVQNLLEGCEVVFVQSILGEQLDLSEGTVSKDERKAAKQIEIQGSGNQMKDEKDEQQQVQIAYDKQDQKLKAYFSPYMNKLHTIYSPAQPAIYKKFQEYLQANGIVKFIPVHVDHCPQSFAIVIQHKSGVKISYSGDCRPSLQFAKQAHKSTLMIHEATFGDDLDKNAKQNMHSTVGQAIDIAMASQSWKLALTHFSQRYVSAKQIVNPSIYKFDANKKHYAENHSVVCFDHLRMRMSDLPLMPYLSKKICEIFPSDSQE